MDSLTKFEPNGSLNCLLCSLYSFAINTGYPLLSVIQCFSFAYSHFRPQSEISPILQGYQMDELQGKATQSYEADLYHLFPFHCSFSRISKQKVIGSVTVFLAKMTEICWRRSISMFI